MNNDGKKLIGILRKANEKELRDKDEHGERLIIVLLICLVFVAGFVIGFLC